MQTPPPGMCSAMCRSRRQMRPGERPAPLAPDHASMILAYFSSSTGLRRTKSARCHAWRRHPTNRPSSEGLVSSARGRRPGSSPPRGASPLRDSAGLSPASLRSMPPQPELRQRYRTASCSCRWRLRAQPGRLMSLEPQSPSSSASPCSIRFRSPAPWPGSRAWSLPVPGAQRTGGRAGQRLAARVERAPLGPTATNAAPRRPR